MPKVCYNCGQPATTKEHIPPKCLFPKGTRAQLITVPSCRDCNESMALDDQYFAAFLSTAATRSPASLDVWKQKVQPQLHREDFQGLFKRLAASSHLVSLPHKGGSIEALLVEAETERLESVLRKIVRGLYCFHHGIPLPGSTVVKAYWELEDWLPEMALRLSHVVVDQDVFAYRYMLSQRDAGLSIWWLVFYRTFLGVGTTKPVKFESHGDAG